MFREQQIMEKIVNELGEELDEFISNFNGTDFWMIKEGELLPNKTFKRLLGIVASYNLTTVDELLESAYELPLLKESEKMCAIYNQLATMYLDHGGTNILIRMVLMCFMLYRMTKVNEKLTASEILKDASESELMRKEDSLWYKIKHFIGMCDHPFRIKGDIRALSLISIISGKSIHEVNHDIAEYKEYV